MDDLVADRIVRNEAAFRRANESMRVGREDPTALYPFTCECGFLGCNRILELTVAEYEEVRADSRWFFILPGHEIEDVETVVARHERYLVVQKDPEATPLAESQDPRREAGGPPP